MLRGAGKIVGSWATNAQSQPTKADKLVKIEYAGVLVGLAVGVAIGIMAESVGAGIGIGLAIGIAIGTLSGPR
jgi:F0F1-type ATP synthase assembly protein I